MKRLILVCMFMMCANLVFAEPYYRMSEKDYNDLQAELRVLGKSAITTFSNETFRYNYLNDIIGKLERVNNDSDSLRLYKGRFAEAAKQAAKETNKELGVRLAKEQANCFKPTIGELCQSLAKEFKGLSDKATEYVNLRMPSLQIITECYAPLTAEEQISILKGKISLLEMQLKRFMGVK